MKLFVPPNETVADSRQSMLKRMDVLKDGFSFASGYEGIIDNKVDDVMSDFKTH